MKEIIIKLVIFLSGYFLILPIFIGVKNMIVQYFAMYSRRKNIKPLKETIPKLTYLQKAKRAKKFGFSKRYANNKTLKNIYIISIVLPALISLLNLKLGILFLIVSPIFFNTLCINNTKKQIQEEDTLIERMLQLKRSKMGLINNQSNIYDYSSEFEILEWEDKKITKFRVFIPVTFDPLNQSNFLRDFSIQFGGGRPYEVDENDDVAPGWSAENGVATISLQGKIPDFAPWSAHYLEDPIVQWSFFPLGLGSKGGLEITNPKTGEIEHVLGYDCDGSQAKFCEKNGIKVGSDIVAAPHLLVAGTTGSGKSVLQRNIIYSCLARPKEWLLLGVDLKKVELGMLRKYGVQVGTTFEDASMICQFAQKVMMDRYELMEKKGINYWGDMPDDERGPAILLLCDEAGELLGAISGKDEESKTNAEFQDLARGALTSIARLGRASRVFLVIATQRPDSQTIDMQIRQNLPARAGCGPLPSTISGMCFESGEGARIRSKPKGGIGIKVHASEVFMGQGFFAKEGWIDDYLTSKGLPIDIYNNSVMADKLRTQIEKTHSNEIESMTEADFALLEEAMNS